ncbi:MAG TPA: TetR/AcrR family transcriptional regulator [Saprospiraceae bacterium]|nr:TetR/AcrR family transcriptional regulator [Saprospiraceae bacterium]
MAVGVRFQLNDRLFLRDPQSTALGCRIIHHSILLIDELGFEAFTFKKLAERINSTEASVYRYFENKHLLLIYLVSWYWEWVGYLIDTGTMNVEDPSRKLKIAIENIVDASRENPAIEYVNEHVLHRIVIAEGTKAYHTKQVDEENKEGFFLDYKRLAEKLAAIIRELNPSFPYARTLASTLIEMSNNQIYFAEHLPRLTDLKIKDQNYRELAEMMEFFAFRLIAAAED